VVGGGAGFGGNIFVANQYNAVPGASTPMEIVNRSSAGGIDFYTNAGAVKAASINGSALSASKVNLWGTTAASSTIAGALVVGDGSTAATNVAIGGGKVWAGALSVFDKGIKITGGTTAADTITVDATYGLNMYAHTGASYDFNLFNAAGGYLMRVPVGSSNTEFLGFVSCIGTFRSDGAAGNDRGLIIQSSGASRWFVDGDSTAESGSNAGTNFAIHRYSDAGSYLGTPLTINRSTGLPTFASELVIGTNPGGSSALRVGGNIRIGGSTSTYPWEILASGGADEFYINSVTAGVSRITINSVGSVFVPGGTASSVSAPAVGLNNNRLISWQDASAGYTNCGFVWFNSSNDLVLGARNATKLTLSSTTATFTTGTVADGHIYAGSGTGTKYIIANGAASGTAGGSAVIVQNNGTNILLFGNKSSIAGGTYSATPYVQIGAAGATTCEWAGGLVSIAPAAGIGYGAGAGGTVTQATSKSTGVTLNKICGEILSHNANLLASTSVSFTFTNSTIAANDVVQVCGGDFAGSTNGAYQITASGVKAGSCVITIRNVTGGSLTEQVLIYYAVIKASYV
jgi:hypothetical protein